MSLLTVNGIKKSFGGLKALNDVNLNVEEGTVHAVIGPNGAGKSTLLHTFVGKLKPDGGAILFNGDAVLGKDPTQINQLGISRVFQTPEIFAELSLLENVMIPALAKEDGTFTINPLGAAMNRRAIRERAEHALDDVGLSDKMHGTAANQSRGDKRRLELAMCLVQNPRLLLLDEPTAGMSRADTNNTIELLQKIHSRGMTKVIIEHDMHVVFSLSTRISVMAQGTVIEEGTPEQIKASAKVQEAYLAGNTGEE